MTRAKAGGWLAYGALGLAILGMSGSAILRSGSAGVPGVRFTRSTGCSSPPAALVPWRVVRGGELPDSARRAPRASRRRVALRSTSRSSTPAVLRTYRRNRHAAREQRAHLRRPSGPGTSFANVRAPRSGPGCGLRSPGAPLIVAADTFSSGRSGPAEIQGDLLALAAAVFWAAYMLTTEHVRSGHAIRSRSTPWRLWAAS